MKPVNFRESNCTFAENQSEYQNLPAYKDSLPSKEMMLNAPPHSEILAELQKGKVISCWKLSLRERLKILFRGKLWLQIMTFHNPLQPLFLSVNKWDVLDKEFFDQQAKQNKTTKL